MNIISSTIVWQLPQVDGSYNVRMEYTDDQGNVYDLDLNAPANMDLNARLAQGQADLEAQ
jgi:hypothetical protein